MARLGIDFGTTNTVVTIHDRGVFSVVLHKAETGIGTVAQEVFPSSILIDRSGERFFGIEADRRFAQGDARGGVFVHSLKRQLQDYAEGRTLSLTFDGVDEPILVDPSELLTQFLVALAESIRASQGFSADEPLETVITWPANCNGAQRHVTRNAFREAGFVVVDSLNEPTASAIELADGMTSSDFNQDESHGVAVFDLGGGTFDASLVWIEGDDFTVLSSGGIGDLGGDDFDHELLGMFFRKLKVKPQDLSPLAQQAMLQHARLQKETISTGAVKSVVLNPMDFGLTGQPVSVLAQSYFKRLRPMLEPAVATLRQVIENASAKEPSVTDESSLTIYLVGGSSKLPLIGNMVSKAFPKARVMRTDKPFRSVSMGAAIAAMDRVTFRDVFSRHFGLIRLRDHGRCETFDPIFPAGTPIPRRGERPLEKVAVYHPAHNVGRLRYLECTTVGSDGLPEAGVREWSDIMFPYDPHESLAIAKANDVYTTDQFSDQPVQEVYRCDSDGVITVELQRPACNDARCYEIGKD